ncbi:MULTISPECIES: hypothetical protein [unclassified Moorena]|uniref:hypothetical protein n=1 Tax=unclassified Moorena TaxID=2683338 RepID=UPI0013FF91D1|nr:MULTISPECIES: hypothetical protein [unclassified Moorena]NEO15396.1 hypothetical protein [Moorena sp. SIO3E8]NEQ01102.1 hypothetical protein [Moorena sp. SIO3F7]
MSIFNKIGNGISDLGKNIVKVAKESVKELETAGKTVVKGMQTAQNGLTNLMYPDIPEKQKKVKSMENRYNQQRQKLTIDTHTFQANLKTYQTMVAYNAALLISLTVLKMSDEPYVNYLATIEENSPQISLKSLPADLAGAGKEISFLAGGVTTLRAIRILGTLAKNEVLKTPLVEGGVAEVVDVEDLATDVVASGIGEVVGEADGEVIVEVAAEGAAEAGMAETGVGVVAAAGLFALFSVIQGAEEEHKLNEAIDKINGALNQVDNYLRDVEETLDKVNYGIKKEQFRFLKIMGEFNAIQKAGFHWQYPVGLSSSASFSAAMLHAVGQYGFVNRVRNDWQNLHKHNPSMSWDEFVQLEVNERDSRYVTENEAKQFLELVKQRSKSMQQAKPPITLPPKKLENNTLANSTWIIHVGEANITCIFNANNTVSQIFPNGQSKTQYWSESSNGKFAILAPDSTINPDIDQVYAGEFSGNTGKGNIFSFGMGKTQKFTLTRVQD